MLRRVPQQHCKGSMFFSSSNEFVCVYVFPTYWTNLHTGIVYVEDVIQKYICSFFVVGTPRWGFVLLCDFLAAIQKQTNTTMCLLLGGKQNTSTRFESQCVGGFGVSCIRARLHGDISNVFEGFDENDARPRMIQRGSDRRPGENVGSGVIY